jgi:hypothetical protein
VAALAFAGCVPGSAAHPTAVAGPHAAVAFADADSVATHGLAPGVSHVVVEDARGPWAIHVVEVDAVACRPVLEARKPAGVLAGRAPTSELADGAIATINADFFRLPGGTPVGAHVTRGTPLIGPTTWPLFGVSASGAWSFGTATLRGQVRAGADSAALVQVNRRAESFTAYPAPARGGVALFLQRADTVPADSLARRVLLRLIEGDDRAGRGVVVLSDSPAVTTVVRAGDALLHAYEPAAAWARRRGTGDTIAWRAEVLLRAQDGGDAMVVREAVGGFPALLRDRRDVLHEQTVSPPFGEQRHPRTAIGWTADGARLYLVVVDGRQPPYSDGMSLMELTWVFRRLGAAHALNLDGGGSTALVIGDRLANRPSDNDGERAVGNALALARCVR